MTTQWTATDDQRRAAAHEALLRSARSAGGADPSAAVLRRIARPLCTLSEREREAFTEIVGFDCCT